MPGQERAAAKAPGDRDSGTYNHKPKGRQKAARNSNIALHSITHTYRMERLPGIEPKYKRNGLPYSYHINKDTKEKNAGRQPLLRRHPHPDSSRRKRSPKLRLHHPPGPSGNLRRGRNPKRQHRNIRRSHRSD